MKVQKNNNFRFSELEFRDSYDLTPTDHFIKVEKLDITVRIQVIGKGNPVLFVHGAPGSGNIWYPLVSQMSDCTCIILDRPGCGLSDILSYKNLTRHGFTEIMISIIDSVLQHLKIEKVSVVASSFGNYLMLLYALKKPERINKLVLEGCPAMVVESDIPKFMKAMLYPVVKWIAPKVPSTKSFFRMVLRKMGHNYSLNHNSIPEAFIKWYVSLFNNTSTLKNELSMISKALPGGKKNPDFILWDHEIDKIQLPALWLWGRDDTFGPVEIGKRLNSRMKNSRIVIFENSGHLPWIDKPEIHAIKIMEFLSTGSNKLSGEQLSSAVSDVTFF